MKKIRIYSSSLIIVIALFLTMCGCNESGGGPSAIQKKSKEKVISSETQPDMSTVYTRGNYSYIPINKKGYSPYNMIQEIIQIMNDFEKNHPDLEIVSWNIEKQQDAHMTNPKVFGIWITHRKKNPSDTR